MSESPIRIGGLRRIPMKCSAGYTEALFKSVPKLGAYADRLDTISGTVPNPARFPSGCKFHPRCPRTRELATKARGSAAGPSQETVGITASGERFRILKRCQTDE